MRLAGLVLALAACGPPPRGVAVLAAASLQESMAEIAAEWTRRTGEPVRLQFGASPALARQIEAGAAADVFISAGEEWTRRHERVDWVAARLVVVAPAGRPFAGYGTVAIAGESVPAGRLARRALERLGVRPARVLYGESVRDVLSKVSSGGADAGFVYATDAAVDPGVQVVERLTERARYSAARVSEAGRGFWRALREPWALEIAHRRGFER